MAFFKEVLDTLMLGACSAIMLDRGGDLFKRTGSVGGDEASIVMLGGKEACTEVPDKEEVLADAKRLSVEKLRV